MVASFWRAESTAVLAGLRRRGLDIAEVRMDLANWSNDAAVRKINEAFAVMPTILTVRPAYEGGGWRGGDDERGVKIRAWLPRYDAVDIELAARDILADVAAACREHGKTLIISRHNFVATDTKADIVKAMEAAFAAGADVFKYAAVCTTADDLAVLSDFAGDCRRQDRTCVITGMGGGGGGDDYVRQARQCLPRLGSCLAYAAAAAASAPGQMSLAETTAACGSE